MITTRDIKVCIFSIFITTLCLALFNNNPIKEAEAQGGMPPMGAPGMAPPGGDECSDLARKPGEHPCRARVAHDAMESALDEVLEKLDTLLAR